jgi:hypothetical protein
MNTIKQLSVALLLSVIVLASAASAGFNTTLGGTASQSTSDGGNVGIIAQAVYSDTAGTTYPVEGGLPDSGAVGPASLPANIVHMLDTVSGQMVLHSTEGAATQTKVLAEGIQSESSVPVGSTGSASSQFVTNGVQNQVFTFTPAALTDPSYQLGVSVDGTVQTAASKTSVGGVADSIATIWAAAGISTNVPADGIVTNVAGQGLISSAAQLTGTGSVLAQADGAATFHAAGASTATTAGLALGTFVAGPTDLEAHGAAIGSTKLVGSNLIGGHVEGWAESSAYTQMSPTAGSAETEETLLLNAQRDISFNGPSSIDGLITKRTSDTATTGAFETAESSYTPGVAVEEAVPRSVDIESHSLLDGLARASARNDQAFVGTDFETFAQTALTSEAMSKLDSVATASRDFLDPANAKVQAEGYVRYADWGVNALTGEIPQAAGPSTPAQFASVAGQTGLSFDGQSVPSVPGTGVGAWLYHTYTAPVSARFTAFQEADTAGGVAPAESLVYENTAGALNGMTVTGQVNDAVGFYGGLDNLAETTKMGPAPQTTTTQVQTHQDAIEWFEGTNSNFLPGKFNFNPSAPGVVITTGSTATGRTLGLTYAAPNNNVGNIVDGV